MSAFTPPFIPRGHIAGLALSKDSGSPTTTIDIAAGQAADSTSAAVLNSTGTLTVSLSSTGAGGLDTGSVANSTWYHLFIIGTTGGAVAGLASTSVTPSLPSGYSVYRRIGSVKTDGSSHILAFKQTEETFYWAVPTLDVNISSSLSNTVLTALTLNVPPGVKVRPLMRYAITQASSLQSADETSTLNQSALTTAPGFDVNSNSTPSTSIAPSYLYTNTSAQLNAISFYNNGTALIITRGWIDSRGRFA